MEWNEYPTGVHNGHTTWARTRMVRSLIASPYGVCIDDDEISRRLEVLAALKFELSAASVRRN
jgi:hypothetical protein